MTDSSYASALDLAAGAFLLTGVLMVWRRELPAMLRLLAVQGAALAALPLIRAFHDGDAALAAVGVAILVLRVVILPVMLSRAIGPHDIDRRQSSSFVSTTASLLSVAALTIVAFAVTRPLVNLDTSAGTQAVPAAFAVVLIALFVMISRRRALSQAIGFLMLDNGIAATAFLITAGVPLIVELGASLDVLFAVLVLGVLTGRLHRAFGDTDLDQLRELHD